MLIIPTEARAIKALGWVCLRLGPPPIMADHNPSLHQSGGSHHQRRTTRRGTTTAASTSVNHFESSVFVNAQQAAPSSKNSSKRRWGIKPCSSLKITHGTYSDCRCAFALVPLCKVTTLPFSDVVNPVHLWSQAY